jgi:hypothetical protein
MARTSARDGAHPGDLTVFLDDDAIAGTEFLHPQSLGAIP